MSEHVRMLGRFNMLHFPFLSQNVSVASRVASRSLCSAPADEDFLQDEEISAGQADPSRHAVHRKEPLK